MPSEPSPSRRRERSVRYPGVPLSDAVDLARQMEAKGLDRLPAEAIARGLGYTSIKTHSFAAPLSAARQFGLLKLQGSQYELTGLAREILHPVDPGSEGVLYRRALLEPPLYGELAVRLAGKRVPEPAVLANQLYHHHGITASAKESAAEAFLASARFAGALAADGTFHPEGLSEPMPRPAPPPEFEPDRPPPPPPPPRRPMPPREPRDEVRIDLRLWDADHGKVLRLRAPESITRASFERFLQAFRLHVRIEDEPDGAD